MSVGIVPSGWASSTAHQAVYLHRLFADGGDLGRAISGVGVHPGDARMRDVMARQQNLYTLVVKHSDGQCEPRIVGAIADFSARA